MDKKIEIRFEKNNEVNAEELIDIFKSVEWRKNPNNIVEAFKNSYYITAYHGEKLIGFARAISDNCYYTNIFDVIVRPEYQKKGIGKKKMLMLRDTFKGTYFFLTYTEGRKEFYEKCGFEENDRAMWIHIYKS
ncbi:MAG: GNAT family N-acetyltransferase [Candidatus Cloacimonetes bacterium]|nr:GNAT family N-acetyltransferase [Candidatus Cloacimonadota bacterium]